MVNNINPTTSKLLEQIKRLSTHTTRKEGTHVDFKDGVMHNQSKNASALKKTNLLNSIERIQKKSTIPMQPLDNIKGDIFLKDVQTSERSKFLDMQKTNREECLGSFLDTYL